MQSSINRQNGSVYSADFYGLLTSYPGGGGTPLQEANGDVPLEGVDLSDFNGVALSIELLGWGRKFRIFGVSRDSKWEDSRLQIQKVVVY